MISGDKPAEIYPAYRQLVAEASESILQSMERITTLYQERAGPDPSR